MKLHSLNLVSGPTTASPTGLYKFPLKTGTLFKILNPINISGIDEATFNLKAYATIT